jgi:hypothetical protein
MFHNELLKCKNISLITCWGFGCWSKIPPKYQELQLKDVPKVEKDGV